MPLLLDAAHAAFVQKAANEPFAAKAVQAGPRVNANAGPRVLAAASLVPSPDCGTPGKYYSAYAGSTFPREAQLEFEAEDLRLGNTDSNNNPPCAAEVFADVPLVAPCVHYDAAAAAETHTQTALRMRKYAHFLLDVLKDVSTTPLPPWAKVVITTLIDPQRPSEVQAYNANGLACPFCSSAVLLHARCFPPLFACRTCGAKWTNVNGKWQHSGKRRVDSTVKHPCPTVQLGTRISAHFRIKGVQMTPQDALAFVRVVASRNYAHDRSIPPAVWDTIVDTEQATMQTLNKVLHPKVAICCDCRGSGHCGTAVSRCNKCNSSGHVVLRNSVYRILDVLYSDDRTFLTDRAAADRPGSREALQRSREDVKFIVGLCSIAVATPREACSTLALRDSALASLPSTIPATTPTGRVSQVRPEAKQQQLWRESARKCFSEVPNTLHQLLYEIATRHEPRYAKYCVVKSAFYTTATKSQIVVHICGDGATFCRHRLAVDRARHGCCPSDDELQQMGYHKSTHALITVTARSVRYGCFKAGCGDLEEGRGDHHDYEHPITSDEADALFPAVALARRCGGGGGGGGGVDDKHSSGSSAADGVDAVTPFLHDTFGRDVQTMRRFMTRLVAAVRHQNATAVHCAHVSAVRPQSVTNLLSFYQRNGFTASYRKCVRSPVMAAEAVPPPAARMRLDCPFSLGQ